MIDILENLLKEIQKTWTSYFVYASPGIAKHHCNHIRVKAHAVA